MGRARRKAEWYPQNTIAKLKEYYLYISPLWNLYSLGFPFQIVQTPPCLSGRVVLFYSTFHKIDHILWRDFCTHIKNDACLVRIDCQNQDFLCLTQKSLIDWNFCQFAISFTASLDASISIILYVHFPTPPMSNYFLTLINHLMRKMHFMKWNRIMIEVLAFSFIQFVWKISAVYVYNKRYCTKNR